MVRDTNIKEPKGDCKGRKKDLQQQALINKRQQKRRDIEDIDNFIASMEAMGIL